ncbi:hypothetical protein ANN_20480 [Periplaneta americana]|uniref:Histone-lysine N-methyltransferase SETMAR n=1 Tax=Periplaneta americana TaxID=6978 RepID=A0ABQ8SCS6_PERAM|nr:hypothetical protein ANN_20480 [Periplaneta americana]
MKLHEAHPETGQVPPGASSVAIVVRNGSSYSFSRHRIAPIEIHQQLCQVYGPNIMKRSGRPSLINDDRVGLVRQCIMENRRFTITELSSHFPQISRSLLHEIVTKHLCSKKCVRGAALTFLQRYHDDGDEFLDRIVTGDDTWISHFTPETKHQSMHWRHSGFPVRTKFKQSCRVETVNADRYCETLRKLQRAIQNKRRGMLTAGVVLLHDNARPHTAWRTAAVLTEFGWELFDHPPYNPDLAPSDFHVFLHLKKFLSSGERFGNDEELKTSVTRWFHSQFTGGRLLRQRDTKATKGNIEGGGFDPVLWIEFGVAQWSERLNASYEVYEEVGCVSSDGSTRRADIIIIDRQKDKDVILDPTIRFEMHEQQPQELPASTLGALLHQPARESCRILFVFKGGALWFVPAELCVVYLAGLRAATSVDVETGRLKPLPMSWGPVHTVNFYEIRGIIQLHHRPYCEIRIARTPARRSTRGKRNIHEPSISFYKDKYHLEPIVITGLMIGARGTIPRFLVNFCLLRASESYSLDDCNRVMLLDTILKLESMNRISFNSCSENNDFTAATEELAVLSNASITSIILP